MNRDLNRRTYSIERYVNVHAAYFPSFFADGKRVAFLSNQTGIPQVYQAAIPKAAAEPLWPDPLTFGADRVQGVWCSPAPGDERLIFARDVGGNENSQLWLIAPGEERCLTPDLPNVMHIFGEWSADGQQIIFAANRRDPGLFDLYVQPIDGRARLVWQHDTAGYLVPRFSVDGQQALVRRVGSNARHELLLIDLQDSTARLISPENEIARYEAAVFAPDGRTLYMVTDLQSEFLNVVQRDLATGTIQPIITPGWDIDTVALSPDGRKLAYTVNIEGASTLYVRDLITEETRQAPIDQDVPSVVGLYDLLLTFSVDSTQIGFSFTSAVRTSDVYVWHLADHQIVALTRSSHAGLPLDSFGAPELVHYPTFDTHPSGAVRQIPAWYYRPIANQVARSRQPVPAILVVHGGPEGQFQPYFNFLVQFFLNNGYAVLATNVRGSTGYGKTYVHLDDVEKRMDSVADLAHAAYWLKTQPEIAGDKIVVYGGSYGGFMVLAALVTYPDLWAAGVDIVGISNFVTFLENTSAYRRAHRESEYGSLERNRDFLAEISPLNHADKISAPLIVIHGANDPRVPVSEARQLVEKLRARDVAVDLLVFDDEGHGLAKLKNKLVAYPAIVAFLAKQLS